VTTWHQTPTISFGIVGAGAACAGTNVAAKARSPHIQLIIPTPSGAPTAGDVLASVHQTAAPTALRTFKTRITVNPSSAHAISTGSPPLRTQGLDAKY
jgi:threonine dehydratase